MSEEDILAEKKRKRIRDPEADSLRLQPAATLSDPLGVILSEAEREEAYKMQLEHDQTNVLKFAQEEAATAQLTDPLQAQADELENIKKMAEIKKEEIEWFKNRINKRRDDSPIIATTIHSPKEKGTSILIHIKRGDTTSKVFQLEWLEVLSITEWLELGNLIAKSRSKLKATVIDTLRNLFVRLVRIQREYKLTVDRKDADQLHLVQRVLRGQPIQHPRNKRKSHFAMLHDQGVKIDASGIDLSIPTSAAQPETTIITVPEYGIFFEDVFGAIGFFRIRDIPNASVSFLQAILGVPQKSDDGDLICRMIMDELKRREHSDP